jgi:hypothetical protein
MPKFKVSVEKRMYCTGAVEVEAQDADAALEEVKSQINMGALQTDSVEWDDPEYEDCSLATTGDVD